MGLEAFKIDAWRLRDILKCENGGRNEAKGRNLPNMGKKCETRICAGQNASGGSGSVRNRCLAITEGFRVRKRGVEQSRGSKFGTIGQKTRKCEFGGRKRERRVRNCSK